MITAHVLGTAVALGAAPAMALTALALIATLIALQRPLIRRPAITLTDTALRSAAKVVKKCRHRRLVKLIQRVVLGCQRPSNKPCTVTVGKLIPPLRKVAPSSA